MEGQSLGKYEIRTRIGRGAMAIVYEAWNPVTSRKVAIKTLPLHDQELRDVAFRSRFRGAAQAAGRLYDPNVVSVFDYGETDELAYIVMEYVEGASLDTRLTPGQALPCRACAPHSRATQSCSVAGRRRRHDAGRWYCLVAAARAWVVRRGAFGWCSPTDRRTHPLAACNAASAGTGTGTGTGGIGDGKGRQGCAGAGLDIACRAGAFVVVRAVIGPG